MYPYEHTSPSSLNSCSMCGHKFQREKYYGEIELPDLGRTIGLTIHDLQQFGLTYIIDRGGAYPELEECQKMAVHFFELRIREDGLRLKKSDLKKGTVPVAVEGDIYHYQCVLDAKLAIIEYAKLHLEEILPVLNPIDIDHIEKQVFLEIPGMKYKLKMYMDVVEQGKVRDLKCLANKPKTISQSDQYVAYSLWYFSEFGDMPVFVQDTLVKTKTPQYVPIEYTFKKEDFDILFAKMRMFEEITDKEAFPPATYFGWWCNDGCGFASTCEYVYENIEEKIIKPIKF